MELALKIICQAALHFAAGELNADISARHDDRIMRDRIMGSIFLHDPVLHDPVTHSAPLLRAWS